MSAWHSEIREEGVKWACFAEGGARDPRMDHFMASSYQEARDWVDAAYIRKTTPKVKKPPEPVYVSEQLSDNPAAYLVPDIPDLQPDYAEWSAEEIAKLPVTVAMSDHIDASASSEPADWPIIPKASPLAETATGDQAASAEAPKRRGRPPKVSA